MVEPGQLANPGRFVIGIVGGLALVLACVLTLANTFGDKPVNSIAMGALFVIGFVLLVLSVAGWLPQKVSLSQKGLDIDFLTEYTKAVAEATTAKNREQLTQSSGTLTAASVTALAEQGDAKLVPAMITDTVVPQLAEQMSAPSAAELLGPALLHAAANRIEP